MRTIGLAIIACMLLTSAAPAAGWFSGEKEPTPVTQKRYASAGDIAGTTAHDDGEPGFFTRMSTGTRSFFSRMNRSLWPSQPKTSQVSRKTATRKSGGFSSWFQPDEPAPPRTVDEWLSLERPKTP